MNHQICMTSCQTLYAIFAIFAKKLLYFLFTEKFHFVNIVGENSINFHSSTVEIAAILCEAKSQQFQNCAHIYGKNFVKVMLVLNKELIWRNIFCATKFTVAHCGNSSKTLSRRQFSVKPFSKFPSKKMVFFWYLGCL